MIQQDSATEILKMNFILFSPVFFLNFDFGIEFVGNRTNRFLVFFEKVDLELRF